MSDLAVWVFLILAAIFVIGGFFVVACLRAGAVAQFIDLFWHRRPPR